MIVMMIATQFVLSLMFLFIQINNNLENLSEILNYKVKLVSQPSIVRKLLKKYDYLFNVSRTAILISIN